MHLTLRQLKIFESVARHLNFTLAARELHLSQPAVSMQISQLEDSIGLPLLEKIGKKIHLTEAGQEMRHYCQRLLHDLRELGEVMAAIRGGRQGHLRISVATTANHFATRLLAAFIERYPGTRLSLDVTNRKRLLAQLANHDTELVIMGEPPVDEQLRAAPFMENPLVVIASSRHPLAQERTPIPLRVIAEQNFVAREAGSGTRAAMERFFLAHGLPLRTSIEMTSSEAIKQAVEAGLGLGIVSIHTLELELETRRLQVLEVEDFPIRRHWYLVHSQGKRLSPIAQSFSHYLLGPDAAHRVQSPLGAERA